MSRKTIKSKRIGKIEYRLIYNEKNKIYFILEHDDEKLENDESDDVINIPKKGYFHKKEKAEEVFNNLILKNNHISKY